MPPRIFKFLNDGKSVTIKYSISSCSFRTLSFPEVPPTASRYHNLLIHIILQMDHLLHPVMTSTIHIRMNHILGTSHGLLVIQNNSTLVPPQSICFVPVRPRSASNAALIIPCLDYRAGITKDHLQAEHTSKISIPTLSHLFYRQRIPQERRQSLRVHFVENEK
jgi:hypothetical protein